MKSVQIRSFFWSVFSCIRTEYGDIRSSQYEYRKIRIRKNSVFGHYFSVFSPNTGKYRPEKTPYLDTFQTVHDVPEGLRYHPKSRAVVSQWCKNGHIKNYMRDSTIQYRWICKIIHWKMSKAVKVSKKLNNNKKKCMLCRICQL